MIDLIFVYVSEDGGKAEALASLFADAGCSIGDAHFSDGDLGACGGVILLWSAASIRSKAFLATLQRALDAHKAVVACLIPPPPEDYLDGAAVFDLHDWDGTLDDPHLDGMFFSVDHRVTVARSETLTETLRWTGGNGWTEELPTAPLRVLKAPAADTAPVQRIQVSA